MADEGARVCGGVRVVDSCGHGYHATFSVLKLPETGLDLVSDTALFSQFVLCAGVNDGYSRVAVDRQATFWGVAAFT